MPTVTLTLTDTPAGGVAITMDFKPAIGQQASPAQADALDFVRTHRKRWGDWDTTPVCKCPADLNASELARDACARCGKAVIL